MRQKRGFILFFILLFFLLLIWGYVYASRDYSQLKESTMPNYTEYFMYGKKNIRLQGNLSESGLVGIDERPAFLSRSKAIFTENIKSGDIYTLEKYDTFNIMEIEASDNFYQRDGYGLLPKDEAIIKNFMNDYLAADQKQQDYIWSKKISTYNDFNAYGYYELDGRPYYLVSQLVAFAGGKYIGKTNGSDDLSDMSEIKATHNFFLSPYPEILSAEIKDNQLHVDFNAYGYMKRNVELTVQGDQGSKPYKFYDVTDTTFHDVWKKDVSDFISLTGSSNLKVILQDGFGREVEAMVQRPLNLSVNDFKSSPDYLRYGDQISVSVVAGNDSAMTITTELVQEVDGREVGRKTITLPPGSSTRVEGFPITAPFASQIMVSFTINPKRTQPSNETYWFDNRLTEPVNIDISENLYINFRNLPPSATWNELIPVKVVVGNVSSSPITTTVTVRDDYKYSYRVCEEENDEGDCIKWKWVTDSEVGKDTRTITVPAQDEFVYTVNMPSGWDFFDQGENKYTITLTGEVNPSRTQPEYESTFHDNKVVKKIHVNPVEIPKVRVRLFE